MEKAKKLENFEYLSFTEATIPWLKDQEFDAVVFATGGNEIVPKFENIDKANVVEATELLQNPSSLKGANKAVVIGGGVVGCETAYWLAYEHGLDVTVVEMEKYFMNHVCTANRGHLIYYMEKEGVKLLNCTRVIGFEENGVRVIQNVSDTVPDPYLVWHPILPENVENPLAPKLKKEAVEKILEADIFVVAVGNKPNNDIFYKAQEERIASEIYNIGDSLKNGKVLEATRAANALARTL